MNKFVEYLKIAPVFSYFLRVFKKDTEGKYPSSFNLKMMHGINRISIVMFLICVIVMIVRAILR
ncbi:MAG: hypothetical protein MUF45_10410 [Spirosomaceae bacterium]|nr:hypothetical protein [Spirosomataceae bacterium]